MKLRLRLWIGHLAAGAGILSSSPAAADQEAFSTAYTVEVKDTANHLYHVTASFGTVRDSSLQVALPVWTPGVYEAKYYAVNVSRLLARDAAGNRLRAHKVQPSTWQIQTAGAPEVIVEFDYAATDLSSNGAAITSQFAFFTGTQLFLEPVGYRDTPSTVRFVLPDGWRVASALRETGDSLQFAAANYDELVDAPTVLGSFDLARLDVDGKPHFLAVAPAGAECADNFPGILGMIPRIIEVQRSIFGSLPYDEYGFFCLPDLGGSSLEHANSVVTSWLDPVNLAHELFHLWNVKRIRPSEMWPYDYSRVNPGPSLWVSEGITSYYEALTAYRAGLAKGGEAPAEGAGMVMTRPDGTPVGRLLDHLAYRISQVESNPERHYVSVSDASRSEGLEGGTGGVNYYHVGEVLGALLDLSILRDTGGNRGLDDVMRALYTDRYANGSGFTPDDVVRIVSAVAGRDYGDFFQRYVTGTEVPPYDSIFADIGYRVSRSTRSVGFLGLAARSSPDGRHVYLMRDPQSPAALAGVRVRDLILAVDGVPIHEVPLTNVFGRNWIGGRFADRAGERVVLTILRDGVQHSVPVELGTREETVVRIETDPWASPAALAIRGAWLRR